MIVIINDELEAAPAPPASLTHSLTSPALKSALAGGGGIVEAVSPLRRPLWAKHRLSLDSRTAHVIHAHVIHATHMPRPPASLILMIISYGHSVVVVIINSSSSSSSSNQ